MMQAGVRVGELGPTPDAHHGDTARRHSVQVPDLVVLRGGSAWRQGSTSEKGPLAGNLRHLGV